jgi:hypothetical protein
MSSRASENGLGEAARSVSEHASALARLEVRLAKEELRDKLYRLGGAAAFGVLGLVLALFALGFGLAAASAGLDEVLPAWLSLLVVAVALVGLAGLLIWFALRAARQARPPVPERAIDEAKKTKRALQQPRAVG